MLGCARMHCTPKHFLNWHFFHGWFVRGKWVHVENPPIAPYSTDVAICMWWFYCPRVGGYEIAGIESEDWGRGEGILGRRGGEGGCSANSGLGNMTGGVVREVLNIARTLRPVHWDSVLNTKSSLFSSSHRNC